MLQFLSLILIVLRFLFTLMSSWCFTTFSSDIPVESESTFAESAPPAEGKRKEVHFEQEFTDDDFKYGGVSC